MFLTASTGIVVFLSVIGLLIAVASYRFVIHRKQLSSGRNIGRFFPEKRDGKYVFNKPFTVTAGRKWCRLILSLKCVNAHTIKYSPKYFFRKVALFSGTPYSLVLKDRDNRILYSETGSLEPFVKFLWSREKGTETMLSEKSKGEQWGSFTFLEFMPQKSGGYFLSLEIEEKASAEYPGSSSTWEILEAELTAMEDVIPLSKISGYPHKRINI